MPDRLAKFVTHNWPHFDEAAEIALLTMYGEDAGLRGIGSIVDVTFVDAGSEVPPYLADRDWEEERIIPAGVFGSWSKFDEHPDDKQARKFDECAASLTLKFLRSRAPGFSDPQVEALVAYATRIDNHGGATPTSLPNIIKDLNWSVGEKAALNWTIAGILAYLENGDPENHSFEFKYIASLMEEGEAKNLWIEQGEAAMKWEHDTFQQAVGSIKDKSVKLEKRQVSDQRGRRMTIVATQSDNPLMGRALISYLKVDVAIVRKPTGHTFILTNAKTRMDLTSLARTLNVEELRLRGITDIPRFVELGRSGFVKGSVWAHITDMRALLNGSPSAPSILPTAISFERIIELAVLALDESRFCTKDEGFACDGKTCNSSPRHSCPFFGFGLVRCTEMRKRAKFGTPDQPVARVETPAEVKPENDKPAKHEGRTGRGNGKPAQSANREGRDKGRKPEATTKPRTAHDSRFAKLEHWGE